MMFSITDQAPMSGIRITSDGYLVGDVNIARTGIQIYSGAEMGHPEMPAVRVYRPESSVFDRASMASMAHRPVTMGHPNAKVNADSWKTMAVGHTSADVVRNGDYVRVPMILMDAEAISAVQGGTRELSVGYVADINFEAGTTPNGETYDATQTNIRANHIAVVNSGRAGSKARIGDAALWGEAPEFEPPKGDVDMADAITTRTVMIDGLSVETTDAGAQALDKLQTQIADGVKSLTDAKAAFDADLAKKDAEIATKDAEIEKLKAAVLDDKALDTRVQARADLVAKAQSIVKDFKVDGLSDAEIRSAVVKAKIGDKADGKAEAYLDARFDILADEAAEKDPLKIKVVDNKSFDRDTMYADRDAKLSSAWETVKEAANA